MAALGGHVAVSELLLQGGAMLDALLPSLPTAALIFTLRFLGISIGSYWGGRLGGSKPEHYQRYWMAFITQARRRTTKCENWQHSCGKRKRWMGFFCCI